MGFDGGNFQNPVSASLDRAGGGWSAIGLFEEHVAGGGHQRRVSWGVPVESKAAFQGFRGLCAGGDGGVAGEE